MRAAPASLKTRLGARPSVLWSAHLVTLTLLDGVTKYRWTTAETNIPVSPNTFLAPIGNAAPLIKAPPYRQNLFPAIDTFDLTLAGLDFTINGSTLPLLAIQGYFDGARVNVDHLIGPDLATALSDGPIPAYFEGRVAGMDPRWPELVLRVKSSLNELNQELPKIKVQPQCSYAVYDAGCGLSRAAFTLTGTASGVPTTTTVPTASAALTAKLAGYFDLGILAFTTGALTGFRRAISSWAGNVFTLDLPLPSAPAAGDAISVYPGCDRSKAKCGPVAAVGTCTTGNTTTTAKSTTASIIAQPNGYFVGAPILFTSGAQNGQTRVITAFTVVAGTATFTWSLALPGAPANADGISIAAGGVFNNWAQLRSFGHVPTPESAGV